MDKTPDYSSTISSEHIRVTSGIFDSVNCIHSLDLIDLNAQNCDATFFGVHMK